MITPLVGIERRTGGAKWLSDRPDAVSSRRVRRFSASALCLTLLVGAAPVRAEVVLRMASVAPDGTAYAREIKALANEVLLATHGEVRLKLYLSGITGDEEEMAARMKRGQLDAVASAGMMCRAAAPTLRVLQLPGLVENREELRWLVQQMHSTFEEEAKQAGIVMPAAAVLGPQIIMSSHPVRNLEDFKHERMWMWDLDRAGIAVFRGIGINVVPVPVHLASQAKDQNLFDGFIALPSASLAFQFALKSRYLSDVKMGYLTACIIVSQSAFDTLPIEHQKSLRSIIAKYSLHTDEVMEVQDNQLLSGLFEKQGLRSVPWPPGQREEMLRRMRATYKTLPADLVPHEPLLRVLQLLDDYRAKRRR
jgi:TRAP-type C4-dicarboxylate transport system substrate-binding protein